MTKNITEDTKNKEETIKINRKNDPKIQQKQVFQTGKSYQELENECVSHMLKNDFHLNNLPLNTTGKRICFAGRIKSKEIKEWYRASQEEDGRLIVTYNSFHSDLKRDKNFVFSSKPSKPLDEKESKAIRERVAEKQLKREEEEAKVEKKRKDKAKIAKERFNNSAEKGYSHYLLKKQVTTHGIRFETIVDETIILIPMRDENGEIQALQEIYPTKRILPGSDKLRNKNFFNSTKGLFHVLGNIVNGQEIRASEGYATSASCYESTNCTVPHVVTFTAGAYTTIIPKLRQLYPDSHILICADNNIQEDPKKENVGIKEAEKACKLIKNCSIVYPVFPADKKFDEEGKCYADFNDLMIVLGKEEVSRQIKENSIKINLESELTETTNENQDRKEIKNIKEENKLIFFDDVVHGLKRNELGDAELFLKFFKNKYLFDGSEGKTGEFYLWTGTHWKLDRNKYRYQDIETVSDIYEKASIECSKNEEKCDLRDLLCKRAFSLRTVKRIKSVFELVAIKIPLGVEWDHCPGKLPCLNGIVDLTTGKLVEHKPEFFIRSVCPTSYNPQAKRILFNKFLDDITLDNPELKSFLARVFGSALLGIPKEEKVFIFYGKDGRNGKGTIMQTIEQVLGPLAKTFPSEMLLLQRNPPSSSTPRPEKANLQGVRFAIFSEIDEKRQIDAAEVKNLSGGDTISCRRLFSNIDLNFKPSHTMFIQTNFKPKASAKDGALWKRNVLIPFKAEFVEEPKKLHERKKDEFFKKNLLLEKEGILSWLIEGCLEYQRIGLAIPKIVQEETANYRKENDGIQLFIENKCTIDPIVSSPCQKMRNAIKQYCRDQGHTVPTEPEISSYLRDLFGEPYKTAKGMLHRGIGINMDENDGE